MTDVELEKLVEVLRNHGNLARASFVEVAHAMRVAEAHGYKIAAPKAETLR